MVYITVTMMGRLEDETHVHILTSTNSVHWMETFGDPTFEYHRTLVRIWGLLALRLAGDTLLPMHPLDYANELTRYTSHLSNQQGCLALPDLSAAVMALQEKAVAFDQKWRKYNHKLNKKHITKKLLKKVEKANERLTQFERAFIDPEGLPGRTWFKHVVYAPRLWSGYGAEVFPAVTEAMQGDDPTHTRAMEERVAQLVGNALGTLKGKYDDFLDDTE